MKSLAQFIQQKRDALGLSATGLAKKSGLDLHTIEEIEAGKELFLAVTVRQTLAKALKCDPEEIKDYEKDFDINFVSLEVIESLKELILNEAGGGVNVNGSAQPFSGITQKPVCPLCGKPLVTRIARMYDPEDNLMLHPKAHCCECAFQIS
jgi:transcriptional regulator with XRE-family HTH domain